MVEKVEQHRLGPLEVIDVQHHGARCRQRFQGSPHLEEELLGDRRAAAAEPLDDSLRRLARPLQRIDQRPESNPFAVGETAACQDERVLANSVEQLGDES